MWLFFYLLGTGETAFSCHKAKAIGRNVGCIKEPVGQCCSALPLKWEASKTAKVQREENQYLASPLVKLSAYPKPYRISV